MSNVNEYRLRINFQLSLIFGSQESFRSWLGKKEQSGFAPVDEHALGRDMLLGGVNRGLGDLQILTGEGLARLRQGGTNWSRTIRENFEKAESEWPTVAEPHRALLDRIRKVWKK